MFWGSVTLSGKPAAKPFENMDFIVSLHCSVWEAVWSDAMFSFPITNGVCCREGIGLGCMLNFVVNQFCGLGSPHCSLFCHWQKEEYVTRSQPNYGIVFSLLRMLLRTRYFTIWSKIFEWHFSILKSLYKQHHSSLLAEVGSLPPVSSVEINFPNRNDFKPGGEVWEPIIRGLLSAQGVG